MALSGMLITLPKIISGASLMPMWLPVVLLIRSTPSVPTRIGKVRIVCGRSPNALHQLPAGDQVEELVGAADLDVGAA